MAACWAPAAAVSHLVYTGDQGYVWPSCWKAREAQSKAHHTEQTRRTERSHFVIDMNWRLFGIGRVGYNEQTSEATKITYTGKKGQVSVSKDGFIKKWWFYWKEHFVIIIHNEDKLRTGADSKQSYLRWFLNIQTMCFFQFITFH